MLSRSGCAGSFEPEPLSPAFVTSADWSPFSTQPYSARASASTPSSVFSGRDGVVVRLHGVDLRLRALLVADRLVVGPPDGVQDDDGEQDDDGHDGGNALGAREHEAPGKLACARRDV